MDWLQEIFHAYWLKSRISSKELNFWFVMDRRKHNLSDERDVLEIVSEG